MRKRDLLMASAGALAATAAAGTVAWAAIPGDGGVIQACYTKIGGIVRVIDTAKGEHCLTTVEVPISWSQRGPKGDVGATGAQGPAGQQGDAGPAGSTGPAGRDGADGAQGPPGPVGMHFMGPWQARNYNNNDVVTQDGSSWFAIEFPGPTDVPGSSPDHWALVAQKGADGAAGAQGPPGPAAANGLTGVELVSVQGEVPTAITTLNPGGLILNAHCPVGKVPIGGGYTNDEDTHVIRSFPVLESPGLSSYWGVRFQNHNLTFPGVAPAPVTVYVLCANANR